MTKAKRVGLFLIAIAVCGTMVGLAIRTDRTVSPLSSAELEQFVAFQKLDQASSLQIADSSEPGERLCICVRLVDKATQVPLNGQAIAFYHTSVLGEYTPVVEGDESTARLSGSAITDEAGRVFVDTILPGDYGSSADNRHVHTTVSGAHPEAYDIHFSQFSTYMGRRFSAVSDQFFLALLKRSPDNRFVCFVKIEVKFNAASE